MTISVYFGFIVILLCFASSYNYGNTTQKTHYFDGIHLNACQPPLVMCGLFNDAKFAPIIESNLLWISFTFFAMLWILKDYLMTWHMIVETNHKAVQTTRQYQTPIRRQ